MKRLFIYFFVINCICSVSFSQSSVDGKERKRYYDVQHIKIEVSFDEIKKQVFGECTTTLQPLNDNFTEFELDAKQMNIETIKTLSGTELKFENKSPILKIFTDKPYNKNDKLTFSIKYNCFPKSGLYFVQPDSLNPERPWQIWTQGQGRGNDNWFPMYNYFNDRTTTETIVTVKENYTVLSNGKLLSVNHDKKNKLKTWRWKQSKTHATYLVMLAIGEYTIMKDKYKNTPIDYYVYKGSEIDAKRCFKLTPDMIKFFSKATGFEYPWEQYAQVLLYDFMYGGMENTSATTLNDKRTLYDKNTELDYQNTMLVAHELAHQWWGDLVTQKDGISHWIHEGFATYFEALYHEYKFGKDEFMEKMDDNMESYKEAEKRQGKIPMASKTTPFVYVKGASFLHMLRFVLGDKDFYKSVQLFVKRFAFGNAVTDNFRECIQDITGKDLTWFFNEWLYRASYPHFEVTKTYDLTTRILELTVKQIHTVDSIVPYFTMPIDIEISTAKTTTTKKINVEEKEQVFRFKLDSEPLNVIFDKGSWLVKNLIFKKSKDELLYQLKHAKDAIDRKNAVTALKEFIEDEDVFKELAERVKNDPFWTVRMECLDSTIVFSRPEGQEIIYSSTKDPKSSIRALGALYLRAIRSNKSIEILKNIIKSDSSYTVRGNALVSLALLDPNNSFDTFPPYLNRTSYRDYLKLSAIFALEITKDQRALDLFIPLTDKSEPFQVREKALGAMASLNNNNDKIFKVCSKLTNDYDLKIRTKLISIIEKIHDKKYLPVLNEWMGKEKDEQLRSQINELKMKIEKL